MPARTHPKVPINLNSKWVRWLRQDNNKWCSKWNSNSWKSCKKSKMKWQRTKTTSTKISSRWEMTLSTSQSSERRLRQRWGSSSNLKIRGQPVTTGRLRSSCSNLRFKPTRIREKVSLKIPRSHSGTKFLRFYPNLVMSWNWVAQWLGKVCFTTLSPDCPPSRLRNSKRGSSSHRAMP